MVQPWHLQMEDTFLTTLCDLYFPHYFSSILCVWQRTMTFAKWMFVENRLCLSYSCPPEKGEQNACWEQSFANSCEKNRLFCWSVENQKPFTWLIRFFYLTSSSFFYWGKVTSCMETSYSPNATCTALLYHAVYKSPFVSQQTDIEAHSSLLQILLN